MPLIQIQNATYTYPSSGTELNTAVLKNFSLSVEQGEFVALTGRNGCGKSTVAKLCNGMIVPQEGDVVVDGLSTREEKNIYKIRSNVGLVLQNPDNQLVAGVVEEDVAFGPENLCVEPDEIRRRVKQSLEDVEMCEYRKQAPHKLSGGQKQRVAIAGVLAMEPSCIVFDEPTAMLDPQGRADVMRIINKLRSEKNISVVLITHFMEEAALADRVIVMDGGSIAIEDTPRQVFSKVGLLRRLGLDVPQATELAYMLAQAGLPIREDILTEKECVHEILRLK